MNDPVNLFNVLSNFGGLGIVIGFLIYKDIRADTARDKERTVRLLLEERRLTYDKERLDCDKTLAATIAALNVVIQARFRE